MEPLEDLRRRQSAKWRTFAPDVLPLPVAEMDFGLAPAVQHVLREAVERSDTGYPMAVPALGVALSAFAERRWGLRLDPQAVAPVPDVGVGVVELLRVLTRPGDRVVISPPVYPPFFSWVAEAGRQLVEAPLRHGPEGWRLDLAALERAFAAGAAVYVLCNPQNPVGRVHEADELRGVVELAVRYDVIVVSDEVHGPLVLPGANFTPLLSVPGAGPVAVAVTAASKAWNLAALKCAAIVTTSDDMATAVARLPSDLGWRVGHFGVLASVAALTEGVAWLDQLLLTLDRRRTQLGQLLAERLPAVRWQPPEATYLAWLDCTRFGDGDAPRDLFLDKGRVALEPGLRFGREGSGHVRLNFATSAGLLEEAVTRMAVVAAPPSGRAADPRP